MRQFILLLALIATAYAASLCPTQKIKHCTCVHYGDYGGEDEDDTQFKCMHIGDKDLPGIVNALQNLSISEFILEKTVITKLPSEAFKGVNISRLYIDKAPLTEIHEDAFAGLPFLLDGNVLKSLSKNDFASLDWVDTLILTNNKITKTEEGLFQDMIRLEELSINDNDLVVLDSWWFPMNSSLHYLELSNNHISKIPPTFLVNVSKSLREIVLADNGLTTISQKAFDNFIDNDNSLDFTGNPIVCDTELCWLAEAFDDDDKYNVDMQGECEEPAPLEDTELYELNTDVLSCPKPSTEAPADE
ncbi:Leucine-rich repeat-containing protein 15 [Nymphon striatum]|nr:Leucine-rich repeat-containing protein 15 [Nymphon striatum]